jgi:hypothetical protein
VGRDALSRALGQNPFRPGTSAHAVAQTIILTGSVRAPRGSGVRDIVGLLRRRHGWPLRFDRERRTYSLS